MLKRRSPSYIQNECSFFFNFCCWSVVQRLSEPIPLCAFCWVVSSIFWRPFKREGIKSNDNLRKKSRVMVMDSQWNEKVLWRRESCSFASFLILSTKDGARLERSCFVFSYIGLIWPCIDFIFLIHCAYSTVIVRYISSRCIN